MYQRNEQYNQYPHIQELVMFEPVPQDQWLTAQQIFNQLSNVSYRRVQEVLKTLRDEHESLPENERPYRQLGQAFLYHPDFLTLVDNRKKTTGKDPNSNQN